MIAQAISRALEQMPERRFQKVVIKGVSITAAVFIGLLLLCYWLMPTFELFEHAWLTWANPILETAFYGVMVIVLFLLFPAVSTLVMSLYLDEIADAVEARYYASDSPSRQVPAIENFMLSFKFSAISILINILFSPLYLISLIFPPLSLVLYYLVNGYLLSREYFELVSIRHIKARDAAGLRRGHRSTVLASGMVIAFLMTIPIVNFFAPLFATAFMVHMFKALAARRAAA